MERNSIYYSAIEPYITGDSKTCSYCDKIEPLILYYGKYFYVTAAIGAYMPGYIQLCSYYHRTSATGIISTEREEFKRLSKAIRNSFQSVYGNYGIGFEHGQAGTCLWRENHIHSLCHHMHVHFLPTEIDIHNDIVAKFSDYIEVADIDDMIEIRKNVLCGAPYLYFSPTLNRGYMYSVADIEVPRQFLRRCVAEQLGISEKADWQEYPGVEFYEQTIKDLSEPIAREMGK